MASVYVIGTRPFYYAKIRDPRTLKWRPVRTPFKVASPAGKRNALVWAHGKDAVGKEMRRGSSKETWDTWVPQWLKETYAYNPKTLKRYENCWAHLFEFLLEKEILTPASVEFAHAQDYMRWRTAQTRNRGTPINQNTAGTELKVLSRIMREAHCRRYVNENPLYRMGLKRVGVKVRAELTDADIAAIRKALTKKPEWMSVCFEIAIHQGCRLSETSLPISDVDFAAGTITFRGKGRYGVPNIFTTALHPDIVPMLRRIKERGDKRTCELPVMAGRKWHELFTELGLTQKGASFHSTRVSVITRMARAGVTEPMARRYVGQANWTVHQIYLRLGPKDIASVTSAISTGAKPSMP